MDKGFDSKVADLVAVTQRLDVAQVLMVRRMTLTDPESLKWASARQLELIFGVILKNALERAGSDSVHSASLNQFETMLPPGDESARDAERWMLFDLSRAMLAGHKAEEQSTQETTLEVLEELAADETPIDGTDFATLFDETLARHAKKVLASIAANNTKPTFPLPYYLAPAFAPTYDKVLRQYVLPRMRASRRIRELAASRNWTKPGSSDRLMGMLLSSDNSTPVLQLWDLRWNGLTPEEAKAKGKGTIRDEDNPWPMMAEDAAKNGYMAPTPASIPMLKLLVRLEPELIANGWNGVAQLYKQEFHPENRADAGRPGSFRDGLQRAIEKLDRNAGDFLAMRCFYEMPKVDKVWIKQFIGGMGRTDAERNCKIPLLIQFFNEMPK